jgi:hypothetical protein
MNTRLELEILRKQQQRATGAAAASVRNVGSVSATVSVVDVVGLQTSLDAKASLEHSHTIANVTGLQAALDAKASAIHTHIPGDLAQAGATTGQVLAWSGSAWEPATPGAGSASLSNTQAFLGADVAMANANTWYDGPSVLLAAGTWLLMASATIGRTGTTAGNYNIRISTGTTHYASVQQYHASVANNYAALSCNAIVTLASNTTIKLQAAGTITNDVLRAATPNNSSGANATGLIAVKIA